MSNISEHLLREVPEEFCPRCHSKSLSRELLFYSRHVVYRVIGCKECGFKVHIPLDYIPFANEKIRVFKKL